jgi:hypothetical protein
MTRMLAYRPMNRLVPAACLAAFAGCAAALAAGGEAKTFKVELQPGAVHEECQRVEAGDKRGYSWKSDTAVDFNIHYHRDPEVFYPVKRSAMRGDGGSFAAKTGEDYCWMWSARDKPARLEGRVESR